MVGWPKQFSARDIRRHALFEDGARALQSDAKRFDEQMIGVEWAIATNPEKYPLIEGTNVRVVKTEPWPGAPVLRVIFRIDDDHLCTLLWVEPADTPPQEEDFT